MHVDRCVCFDVTFARLKSHLEAHGGGLDEIQRAFGCGRGCGMCIPYIRRMLQTGETNLSLMSNNVEPRAMHPTETTKGCVRSERESGESDRSEV